MNSNQNEIHLSTCDVQNLKNEVLNFTPPASAVASNLDEHIRLNLDCLASPSLEFLINRMFCLCGDLDNMPSNKPIYADEYSSNWMLQQSLENVVYPLNFMNWNKDACNSGFTSPLGENTMGSLYNHQMYNTDASGSLPSFGFMTSYYAQNGLVAFNSNESSENMDNIRSRKKRNKMSFTMKRIANTNFEVQSSYEQDEKLSSFACRADVIYKKILRDFRRYFINDFKEKTGYKDSKSDKLNAHVVQLLDSYINMVFGKELQFREEIMQTLGSLIFPNQNFSTSSDKKVKSKKEVNKIHDTLYKFSITKVDRLLEDRNVCFLLKFFLCDQANKQALIESSKVCEKSYQTAFDLIENRINVVLNAN